MIRPQNLLALLRLLLVPFILLLVHDDAASARWTAFALLGVAGATDVLDGWVARRRNEVSDAGSALDLVADKVLIGALLVDLAWWGLVPLWAALVMLARESLMAGLRESAAILGHPIHARRLGKLKMWTQSATVACGVLALASAQPILEPLTRDLAILATLLSAWSLMGYGARYLSIRRVGIW